MILDEILANKRREVEERRAKTPLVFPSTASLTERGGGGSTSAMGIPGSPNARSASAVGMDGSPNFSGPDTPAGPPSGASFGGDEVAGRPTGAGAAWPIARGAEFVTALRQPGVSFIAEIKHRSPSGGEIRTDLSVEDLARTYAAAGAAALSVLTDARYFGGSDTDVIAARRASGLPVLRKDFVVDPYQILEARELGADAVLLIVRALGDAELRTLLALTQQCGLAALVEAHSADEVERALNAGATILGINNRDLDTLITDVSLAPRLRPLVPAECICVAESGISRPEDVAVLRQAGVDAVLVGESLLRATDPGAKLRELIGAGMPARVGRVAR